MTRCDDIVIYELTKYNSQAILLVVRGDRLILDGGADIDIDATDHDGLVALIADLAEYLDQGYHGNTPSSIAQLRVDVVSAALHTDGWDWADRCDDDTCSCIADEMAGWR